MVRSLSKETMNSNANNLFRKTTKNKNIPSESHLKIENPKSKDKKVSEEDSFLLHFKQPKWTLLMCDDKTSSLSSPAISENDKESSCSGRKRQRLSEEALRILQEAFKRTRKPSATERNKLAKEVGLSERAVQIWFQNRRAKAKKDESDASATLLFSSYEPQQNWTIFTPESETKSPSSLSACSSVTYDMCDRFLETGKNCNEFIFGNNMQFQVEPFRQQPLQPPSDPDRLCLDLDELNQFMALQVPESNPISFGILPVAQKQIEWELNDDFSTSLLQF